jgi:GST-like protein
MRNEVRTLEHDPEKWAPVFRKDHAQEKNRLDDEVIQLATTTTKRMSSMPDLSAFPITKRWPAKHPDRLQLYSLPTPNGVKVSIMLEEIGLPYEVHLVDFNKDDQKTPEFLALNPNGKIPAILDPDGPGGKPLGLFESGAILQYLAEKTGKLLPSDAARRWQTIQWVHFQMGGIGPMFGQVGFFHKFAGKDFPDKRPLERYVAESKRLLGVLEIHLGGRQWVMDDEYTIADISMLGWVRNLIGFYGAGELVAFDSLKHVPAWLERGLARPAVERGLNIPKRP